MYQVSNSCKFAAGSQFVVEISLLSLKLCPSSCKCVCTVHCVLWMSAVWNLYKGTLNMYVYCKWLAEWTLGSVGLLCMCANEPGVGVTKPQLL